VALGGLAVTPRGLAVTFPGLDVTVRVTVGALC